MNNKELIEFGERYFMHQDENRTENTKSWIDDKYTIMIKTNRSELINVLNNYQDLDLKRCESLINRTRETTTAKSSFDLYHFKNILKLVTKLKNDADKITFEMGSNTAMIITLEDKKGVVLEIVLAPRIDE